MSKITLIIHNAVSTGLHGSFRSTGGQTVFGSLHVLEAMSISLFNGFLLMLSLFRHGTTGKNAINLPWFICSLIAQLAQLFTHFNTFDDLSASPAPILSDLFGTETQNQGILICWTFFCFDTEMFIFFNSSLYFKYGFSLFCSCLSPYNIDSKRNRNLFFRSFSR